MDEKNISFSEALKRLKQGLKVRRAGWNGKGMWLKFVEQDEWTLDKKHLEDVKEMYGAPWIMMKTADNKIVPWLASQTDIIANDWEVVPKE
mgnify:CR=1 FL=1